MYVFVFYLSRSNTRATFWDYIFISPRNHMAEN